MGYDQANVAGFTDFSPLVSRLAAAANQALDTALHEHVAGLSAEEARLIVGRWRQWLHSKLLVKLNRVFVADLHAVKQTDGLAGDTPEQRWDAYISSGRSSEFWDRIYIEYPYLRARLDRFIYNRIDACVEFAIRFAADRRLLNPLVAPSNLIDVTFSSGDSHRGGRSVMVVTMETGRIVYKPRSLQADVAACDLVRTVRPQDVDIYVPHILDRGDYGWAEFIPHRYCSDVQEQRSYYRGIGAWCAIMQLVGGTDLHYENIIACGSAPVVIDLETLFCPDVLAAPTQGGDAQAVASELLRSTPLSVGLLPDRSSAVERDSGVENSGAGGLPDQQPTISVPVLEGAGTDEVRITIRRAAAASRGLNLPVPTPHPEMFDDEIVAGYRQASERIDELDQRGLLERALRVFTQCDLRFVARATSTYTELIRALWHPLSLRDQQFGTAEVRRVLSRRGPDDKGPEVDQAVVDAEIASMLMDDIPVFTFAPECGEVVGPDGVHHSDCGDLLSAALLRWRNRDRDLQEGVIRSSLAGAYLPHVTTDSAAPDIPVDLSEVTLSTIAERVSGIIRRLCDQAIWGDDGSVAWIGIVTTPTTRSLRPLPGSVYDGIAGIAVALAAYDKLAGMGIVERLGRVTDTAVASVRTLSTLETKDNVEHVGVFDGLGSYVWGWLLLSALGAISDGEDRALRSAERLATLFIRDRYPDIIFGGAGVIPVLLNLADVTGDQRPIDLAELAAEALASTAVVSDGIASWESPTFGHPIGGFAHGTTGYAWALAKLGHATGKQRWIGLAEKAAAFEDEQLDADRGGWHDLRYPESPVCQHAWCHGSIGIGLANLDLGRVTGEQNFLARAEQAASFAERRGPAGNDVTPCHGLLGEWEFFAEVSAYDDRYRSTADDRLVRALDWMSRFGDGALGVPLAPGLMDGAAGAAYQLMRALAPDQLPSILLPGDMAKNQMSSHA